MSRRPNIIRPVKLTISLPEDFKARMDLLLWSKVERRVPFGAYRQLIMAAINEYLDRHRPTEGIRDRS